MIAVATAPEVLTFLATLVNICIEGLITISQLEMNAAKLKERQERRIQNCLCNSCEITI
jgi:hypothetical protein